MSDPNNPDNLTPTYKVIRFRQSGRNRTIRRGLTLADAQAHCQREDTHGKGWFDGYDVDGWREVRS